MSTLPFTECATRPMLGRKPTMPLKLAGLRKLPPPVEAARRQRVHGAVDLSDTLFQRVEQVVWRHLAALEARHDGYGILADQLVAHSDFPGSWKGLQSLVLAAGTAAVHANAE